LVSDRAGVAGGALAKSPQGAPACRAPVKDVLAPDLAVMYLKGRGDDPALREEETVTGENQPIKVYEGELADVTFLRSLLNEAAIEVVSAGLFFGATREIYVGRRDEAEAREIIADFESRRARPKGDLLHGPWPTD
jgi:hypothetical protein